MQEAIELINVRTIYCNEATVTNIRLVSPTSEGALFVLNEYAYNSSLVLLSYESTSLF